MLKKSLYAIAKHASFEVKTSGPLFMDVLIVRIWRGIKSSGFAGPLWTFELVDAGVRLAIDEGWLSLKDGMINLGPQAS